LTRKSISDIIYTDYTNLNGFFGIYRVLFFSFLLISGNFSAQQSKNSPKSEQTSLVLKNGATIFSTDEAFNKQINNQSIVLKNADLVQDDTKQNKVLEASSKQEVPKKDLKQELKNTTEKKQKEELKKVKKQIDQFEARKKAFNDDHLKGVPSTEEFLASTQSNKDSVAPAYNNYDFSESLVLVNSYALTFALDFLYKKQYSTYTAAAFDSCFSKVYSVRPPPFRS